MRILMLSWEYPPRVVGDGPRGRRSVPRPGAEGNEVDVITALDEHLAAAETMDGVKVHRVAPYHGRPPIFSPGCTS